MRGPLVLVAAALLGGAAFLGFSRYSATEGSDAVTPGEAAVAASTMAAAVDPSLPAVKVYKSPTCGCCTKCDRRWI